MLLMLAGLSPRVRGNRSGWSSSPRALRSIPACAGEPDIRNGQGTFNKVYPRVCGGTSGTAKGLPAPGGLSPRVRGNPRGAGRGVPGHGSIPACAGEPLGLHTPSCRWTVYPRVCGGTGRFFYFRHPSRGLSPRVRGNRRKRQGRAEPQGSIPACAGEPWSPAGPGFPPAVYPRVCGGTSSGGGGLGHTRGLSPRVRGNPAEVGGQVALAGSIPACAGEPWTPAPIQRHS